MMKLMFILPLLMSNKWDNTKMSIMYSIMLMLPIMYSPGTKMNFTNSLSMNSQLSSIMMILSIWIILMMTISSRNQIMKSEKETYFTSIMLWMTITMTMVFSTNNMIMFYIMFEMSIIPTMLLIMLWGYQPERLQASLYMMIYTVVASLPLLMVILLYMKINNSMSVFMMIELSTTKNMLPSPNLMTIPLIMAFLVKTPMFSLHLWLPKAHVEAPMAGSMILAAILLKLGGYGLILTNFMLTNSMTNKIIMSMAMLGSIISTIMCMNQTDMKSLIAYSSINHMGIMIAGIMTNLSLAIKLSLTMMLAHGLSSSLLFMLSGLSFEKMNSRMMILNKSTISIYPILTLMWFLSMMTNMSTPPSINLMAEIFLIASVLKFIKPYLLMMILIIFMSSAYNLFLYTNMNHGPTLLFNSPKKTTMNKTFLLPFSLQFIPALALILITPIII